MRYKAVVKRGPEGSKEETVVGEAGSFTEAVKILAKWRGENKIPSAVTEVHDTQPGKPALWFPDGKGGNNPLLGIETRSTEHRWNSKRYDDVAEALIADLDFSDE